MATDTRQRMIRSTARLIRRQGYYGTGLNDIVAEADAPKGSLYFHFPGGKVQLAAEALDLFGTNVERMLADGIVELGSASAAVAAYLDRVADGFDARGTGNGCAIAVVAAEAAPSEPALAEATSRALRLWTDGLTRQLVNEGHPELQAHALATTAIAAIEGAILLGPARARAPRCARCETSSPRCWPHHPPHLAPPRPRPRLATPGSARRRP
ncbi:MAG: TetR/AcrR family transcriptional regulator [Acidimicrobiales bacterium]